MVQHVDPEVLALLALGEQDAASDDERIHLQTCLQCRAEVDELAAVADRARSAGEETLVAPPERVWDRVVAEVAADAASATPSADDPVPAAGTTRPGTIPNAPGARSPASAEADVVDLPARRRGRRSLAWGAAAAGVALVAGIGGGVAWERARTPAPVAPTPPVAVAEADLEALPEWAGSTGRAVVEESADGQREIRVSLGGADAGDGYREVWLIADDLSGMVSLGMLAGESASFPVPEGLDLERYSLVDVSEEPFDGDPAHSGDSIVRGGLSQA